MGLQPPEGSNFTTVSSLRVGVEVDFTMAVDRAWYPRGASSGTVNVQTRNKKSSIHINSPLFEGLKGNHAIDESFLTSKNLLPDNQKKMRKKSSVIKKFGADKCRWKNVSTSRMPRQISTLLSEWPWRYSRAKPANYHFLGSSWTSGGDGVGTQGPKKSEWSMVRMKHWRWSNLFDHWPMLSLRKLLCKQLKVSICEW